MKGEVEARSEGRVLAAAVAIRFIRIGVSLVVLRETWPRLRNRRIALSCFIAAVIESISLAVWLTRKRALEPEPGENRLKSAGGKVAAYTDDRAMLIPVGCDALFHSLLVAALAKSVAPGKPAQQGNWGVGLAEVAAAMAGVLVVSPLIGLAMSAVMAAAYLAASLQATPEEYRSDLRGNAAIVIVFFVWGRVLIGVLRQLARRVDTQIELIREQEAELSEVYALSAVAAERVRFHDSYHRRAVEILERLAESPDHLPDSLREDARAQAASIRRALRSDGDDQSLTLKDLLAVTAAEFASRGLRIELLDEELITEVPVRVIVAMEAAVRKAIDSVIAASGAEKAVVRAVTDDSGLTVTVREHGAGFDADRDGPKLRAVLMKLLGPINGIVRVEAGAGSGTLVTMKWLG